MKQVALAVLVCAGVALGQTTPKVTRLGPTPPKNLLWVGNSFFFYNKGLSTHVWQLLESTEPDNDFDSRMATISGAPLSLHDLEAYFRLDQPQGFSVPSNQRLVLSKPRPFDAVILQDCSQCPIHPQLERAFQEAVRKDSALAKKHGASTILFMTWAYADKPEMTSALAEAYTRAGNESGALVVPVGLAFAAARAKDSTVSLHEPDNRHPSLAGSYLAACVVLASVYGKSPVGNRYTAGLDLKTAAFLQSVAAETVARYFGR
jgi:hypothetical protein